MNWKILTVFFVQILGWSTVFGNRSCYYNSYTSSYYCYYYYYYDYHYTYEYNYSYPSVESRVMRISRRVRLVNVEILGVIYGSLAGFATLVGLTVCLCMKCRKTTSNQGAVLYETVANVGTGVQRPIQSYNQEGVYTPLPVQQQTPGEFEMVSIALPPQHSAPPTVNQDPQRN